MGWDVVQIGLRHNLPVHDPFATAKEVAKRMNRNIRLYIEMNTSMIVQRIPFAEWKVLN